MNFTRTSRNRFKKSAAVGCLCLTLAFSAATFAPAYAGPADDTTASTPAPVPGSGPAGPGQPDITSEIPAAAGNPYYNQTIPNPVVIPADKYTYEQMERDIQTLAERYPGRVNIQVIGQSLDGRNIYDFIIGNQNAQKKILFQGGIHAREYIVVPLMMQQLEYMLAFQDTGTYQNQPLSALMSNAAIHFVPMVNPDGIALSQFGEGAIRSEELRQAIQNCYAMDVAESRTALPYEQYLVRWKSNARGVDLNHNFDASWETLNPTLSHSSATDYKGAAPLSEPETQALAGLIQQNAFSAVINYHAMGRVIYWDTEGNQKAAESYDMAMAAAGVTGYQILGSKGVGGFKDWLQRCSAPIAGITIEVGRSTCPVAFTEYQSIWEQNKQIPALFCQYILTH